MLLPQSLQKLIEQFSHFPGVGPRTATRYAFYLLHRKKSEIDDFIKTLEEAKKIRFCSQCFAPFTPTGPEEKLCPLCQDPKRNRHLLCIVEKETDLYSIEKTGAYRGLYFIIGSANQWFKRKESAQRAKKLIERMKKTSPKIEEVVLAVNYTAEGQALRSYLENILKPFPVRLTHIRQGLPLGSEVEYADTATLKKALEERE